MEQATIPATIRTAIPPRFVAQRSRVLRILARWEQVALDAGFGQQRFGPTLAEGDSPCGY